MQNYHFSLGGNFLDLISKNYYDVIFMWNSWLQSLFHSLTDIYAWNNKYFTKSDKASKLACKDTMAKLVMAAMHWYLSMYRPTTNGDDGGGRAFGQGKTMAKLSAKPRMAWFATIRVWSSTKGIYTTSERFHEVATSQAWPCMAEQLAIFA